MFPAERGKVLEKGPVDALVSIAEVVCGSFLLAPGGVASDPATFQISLLQAIR